MDAKQQHKGAQEFVNRWLGRGDEKQDSQNFWYDLLHSVYGVDNPSLVLSFESRVKLSHTSFIDGYIPSSKVLIEQKGMKIDLSKKEKQSDGEELTPYEQGFRYASVLPLDDKPRYIVVCNFQEFRIYDQNVTDPLHQEPVLIALKDLPKALGSLTFLTDLHAVAKKAQVDISVQAGELIGKLYDALLKQYGAGVEHDDKRLQSLNKLCVRLVFCLYAEDSGLFPQPDQFGNFLRQFREENIDTGLEKLFRVLNTRYEDRAPSLSDLYKSFPYVNGGLFADDDSEIPPFNKEIAEILINDCSDGFDWSKISPTIFGAIFESTLNPQTRRQGGMHYTSEENIHKVIDPLFLDGLKAELENLTNDSETKYTKKGRDRLRAFQDKLAGLKFLDPACGSGNFLTETYISLRRLENEALRHLSGDMADLFMADPDYSPVKVNLGQFYGIEINDFAVTVAKTALWIAESQLLQETENIIGRSISFLPLKSYSNIHEGNALRMDWNNVVPSAECSYIMGNPPFVGYDWMNSEQKKDMQSFFDKTGRLDYVTAWYVKTAQYINKETECAFVSTNSISQGVQVPALWEKLSIYKIYINFAYRTFIWNSEVKDIAKVHCVIISFSKKERENKLLIDEKQNKHKVKSINPYLLSGFSIYVTPRNSPFDNIPKMVLGNMPKDGGGFIINEDEYQTIKKEDPVSLRYIKRYMMGKEFINNIKRYCFWFNGADTTELLHAKYALKHLEKVKKYRESSTAASTRQLAIEKPTLFAQISQPKNSSFIVVPKVSSSNRRYIPIGYLTPDTIVGDKLFIIPNGDLFCFGILTSSVHNAWMRVVAGRLKSDYSYTTTVVYNTFVWPVIKEDAKEIIRKTAQGIIEARALYPDRSLASLYKNITMPVELIKAHKANDRAVLAAYGLKKDATEEEIVAHLFMLYAKKTGALKAV